MKRTTDAWKVRAGLAAALLAAVCLFFLRDMQGKRTAQEKNFFAMDTYFALTACGPNAGEGLEECERRVRELESLLSVTKEGSDLWRINEGSASQGEGADAGMCGVQVSEDTFALVKAAKELCGETDGALDITLYPVLKEWGFTTGEYKIPQRERLEEILGNVNYDRIRLREDDRAVLVPKGMELDLGAVAKGYAGDCLAEILRERGVTGALLDLGGNIQALGTKPDGSCWRIAVKDPFDKSDVIGVLEVQDKAVVTSGGYERYFVGEDGRDYWHILDPESGRPAHSGLVSVTVVGGSGMRCDGLSTALFVMGKERAAEFWRRRRDFEMILVTEDGTVCFSEGLEDSFECGEGRRTEKIPAQL